MSWRNSDRRVLEPSHKHSSYKNFGSYKKKQNNSGLCKDYKNKGVYSGTYGFVQKKIGKPESDFKSEKYKHFNVKSTKLSMKETRCGVIAFDEKMEKVLCICNKCIYDKYGFEQWGLPKGHMEERDKVYSNCASRELFEETGVRYNIVQNKFVFKRINNTIYYPIIIKAQQEFNQVDKNEILKVEWKSLDQLLKEDITTKHHNQDLKVFLHRYFHDTQNIAQKNCKDSVRKG